MGGWFSKNLGDELWMGDALTEIERRFQTAFDEAGSPDGMALFMRHESDGRLHCEVIVYFSPGAAAVAQAVHALLCPTPSPHGLALIAGSKESWSLLFPFSASSPD